MSTIRGLGNFIPMISSIGRKKTYQSDKDKDSSSGYNGSGGSPRRRRLSEQEISEALDLIKELAGFKENNLQTVLEQVDGTVKVFIQDPSGNVVRRLAESDLQKFLDDRKNSENLPVKGRLLNKSF